MCILADGVLTRPEAVDPTLSEPPALAAANICLEPRLARAGRRAGRLGHAWEVRDVDFNVTPADDSGLRRPLSGSRPPANQTRAPAQGPATKTPGTGGPGDGIGDAHRRRKRGGRRKSERGAEPAAERPSERAAPSRSPDRGAGTRRDRGY